MLILPILGGGGKGSVWRLGEGPGIQGQIWGSFGKVIRDVNIAGG